MAIDIRAYRQFYRFPKEPKFFCPQFFCLKFPIRQTLSEKGFATAGLVPVEQCLGIDSTGDGQKWFHNYRAGFIGLRPFPCSFQPAGLQVDDGGDDYEL